MARPGAEPTGRTRNAETCSSRSAAIRETRDGVAPAATGVSTGSVLLPWYSGEPSSSRAIVVPISSTWLISPVPTPWIRSLVWLGRGVAAEVDALEQVLHHRAHLTEVPTQALLQGVGCCRVWLVNAVSSSPSSCAAAAGGDPPGQGRPHLGGDRSGHPSRHRANAVEAPHQQGCLAS